MRPSKRAKVEEPERPLISPTKSAKGKGTPSSLRTPSVRSFFTPVDQKRQRKTTSSSPVKCSDGYGGASRYGRLDEAMDSADQQSLTAPSVPTDSSRRGTLFLGSSDDEDDDLVDQIPADSNIDASSQQVTPLRPSSPDSVMVLSSPARVRKDDSGYAGSDEAGPSAHTVDGSSSTPTKPSQVPCPCCSKLFPIVQVQRHANQCLDQMTTMTAQLAQPKLEPPAATIVLDDSDAEEEGKESAAAAVTAATPTPASVKASRPLSELAMPALSRQTPPPLVTASTTTDGKTNAFAVMMSSHTHQREWAMADKVEAANSKNKGRRASSKGQKSKGSAKEEPTRQAPFYKVLEGMPISVDAFRFGNIEGCQGYFLSHFHSDHYGGLSANWRHGPVYGSTTTLNLCRTKLGVPAEFLCPLPMEVPTDLPNSGGVRVTLIEANHCPGSTIFLFEGPQTAHILPTSIRSPHIGTARIFRYLHCGDFRASPLHANHRLIKGKRLDIIYLDTTYLNPRYNFPPQEQVVDACAQLVAHARPIDEDPGTVHRADPDPEDCEDWRPRSMRMRVKGEAGIKDEQDDKDGIVSEEELEDEDLVSERPDFVDLADDFDPFDDQIEKAVLKAESQLDEHGQSESIDAIKQQLKEEDDDAGDLGNTEEAKPVLSSALAGDSVPTEGSPTATKPQRTIDDLMQPNGTVLRGRRKTGRLLVVVGTYTIGKEKVVKAAAHALDTKVFCLDARKYSTYAELDEEREDYDIGTVYGRKEGEEGLHALLTRDAGAGVHVTNLHAVTGDYVRDMLRRLQRAGFPFTHAVGLRPTGWSYRPPQGADNSVPDLRRLIAHQQSRTFHWTDMTPTRDSNGDVTVYGVPYSEHSSFFELTAFALSVSYGRLIATVNVHSANSRNKMSAWFDRWKREKERRAKQDGRPLGSVEIVRSRDERYW